MSIVSRTRRSTQAKRVELERRLNEIRSQESTIRERIYKLEASIAASPGLESARRLHFWNTLPPDEERVPRRRGSPTRYQRQLVNRGRSRQAVTALLLMGIAVLLGLWLSWQLRSNGVL